MTKLEDCDAAELRLRNDKLNGVYQDLLHALPAARQEKLRTAERAWLAFKGAECGFRASADQGAMNAPLVASRCELDLLAARIGDLAQALRVARF